MSLPPDNHVHTEWSWDAIHGEMEATCARAAELGLPSVAFTEHVDLMRWHMPITADERMEWRNGERGGHFQRLEQYIGPDGYFEAPPLDVEGYLASVERCRARFPGLRILTGVELGEPHVYADRVAALLAQASFDRKLGSLHSMPLDGAMYEVNSLYQRWPAERGPVELVRGYLVEAVKMIESASSFAILAHVDYPARRWPAATGTPFEPQQFEEEYRAVLAALARSGRALEVNTRLPMDATIVRWWFEVGGDAVSFGSDAHNSDALATGFSDAAAMVEAQGFRPGKAPDDFWVRRLIS